MYLRGPRIFMFLLTQALVGAEVGLSSWSLADGYDKKRLTKHVLPSATLHINDAFGVGGAVTGAAGLSSILCGILLLYTVFHPRRPETIRSIRVKEGLFGTVILLLLGALIPATYITATKGGVITAPGIPNAVIAKLVAASGQDLRYKVQKPIISYLIVGWLAFISTCITFVLVSIAARKTLKYGVDTAGPLAAPAHTHDAQASHSTVDMSDKPHIEHVYSLEEKEQHRAV